MTFQAWQLAFTEGEFASNELLVRFLGVIDLMLRAVVFYIVGVGLYSFFIARSISPPPSG